jgi:NAD(P)-dependent dehydrogenase (short-subunit alcohol dehydrogenase family)
MRLDLAGKAVLVTGAASGIGLACVQAFLAEGARGGAVDRAPIPALDGDLLAMRADVTDESSVAAAVDAVATSATASSRPTISRAAAAAAAGSPLSSSALYSICLPFTPPFAFAASKTAFAARDASGKVAAPLSALTEPTTIGPPEPPSAPAQPVAASRTVVAIASPQCVPEVVQPHARHGDTELAEAEQVELVLELPHRRQVHVAVTALHAFEALPGIALGGHVHVLVEVVRAVPVDVALADQVV